MPSNAHASIRPSDMSSHATCSPTSAVQIQSDCAELAGRFDLQSHAEIIIVSLLASRAHPVAAHLHHRRSSCALQQSRGKAQSRYLSLQHLPLQADRVHRSCTDR